MEDVRAVFVDVYAFDLLGVNIARNVRMLVDDANRFAGGMGLLGKGSAVRPVLTIK